MKKWVCQKNNAHIFDDYNPDPEHPYYCSIDAPFEGILMEEEVLDEEERELSLRVILMEASSSMTNPLFDRIPLTRMKIIANSVASSIFNMVPIQNNFNIYIACFKFDERTELMFVDSVANIIKRYRKIETFADYLYSELFKFQQGANINNALRQAHQFVSGFLNKQLEGFPVKEYTPMLQRILKFNSFDIISIPNIRVLLYTDGMQYDANGSTALNPNPFKQNPLPGLNHDILIAAYLGSEIDHGYRDLSNMLSNCPIHDIQQLFLFDKPSDLGNLKYLFRMASRASGFCPSCIKKDF